MLRTLGAAGPPQPGVGQHLLVLAHRLVVVLALGATHPAGVQPVVRPHGDGHEAEGAESPRRGQQHHHTPVTQPHGRPSLLLLFLFFSGPKSSSQTAQKSLLVFYPVRKLRLSAHLLDTRSSAGLQLSGRLILFQKCVQLDLQSLHKKQQQQTNRKKMNK